MSRTRALFVLGACVLAHACGTEGKRAAPVQATARIFAAVEVEERVIAGGNDADTLFGYIGPMAAFDDGVVVADVYKGTVTRLSRDGDVEWVRGGMGGGPGEFRRVVALQSVGNAVWALDMDNAKVVSYSRAGEIVEERVLTGLEARPVGVLPAAGSGGDWYATASQLRPLVRVDSAGRQVATASLPWDSAAVLSPLATQLVSAADAEEGVLYMAFQLGNGLMRFERDGQGGVYRSFVEPVPFTPVVEHSEAGQTTREFAETPTYAARSVSVGGGRVYVMFGGLSDDRLAVIDVYDAETLAYQESIRLPRRVSSAVVAYPDIYATFSDPYPTIVRYTLSGAGEG